MERSTVEGLAALTFVVWLGWISWEVVYIKSDKNVDAKINAVSTELVRALGVTNGNLNTEIERSKIKDDSTHNWLKATYELANHNKGRIIEIEVTAKLQHQ